MQFAEYFNQLGRNDRRAFYNRVGTSYNYFRALRYGQSKPTNKYLARIVEATEGNCSVHDVASFFNEVEMKNQRKALEALMKKKWVTPIDALREVGCLRLAARVLEMKQAGIPIEDAWVDINGKHYKKYRISRLNYG